MGYTQNEILEKCHAAMFDIGSFYKFPKVTENSL